MKKGFKKALLGIGLSVMTLGTSLLAGCSSVSNLRDQVDQIFCPHKTTKIVEAVAPTCTEDGYTGYEKCLECGKELTKGVVIEATGHKIEVTKGYAATCTTLGLTDKKTCTVCEEVIEEAKEIPATGHTFKDGECEACGATGLSVTELEAGVDYTGYTVRLKYDLETTNAKICAAFSDARAKENLCVAFSSGEEIVYVSFAYYGAEAGGYVNCTLVNDDCIFADFNSGEDDAESYSFTLGELISEGTGLNGDEKTSWVYTPSQNDYGDWTEEEKHFVFELIEFVPPVPVEAAA